MKIELDHIYNMDCLEGMKLIPDGSVDLVLTDIPYGEVNRDSNGLRNLDKAAADVETFSITELTRMLCAKSKGSVYMFCGINQVSDIRKTMTEQGLSTRLVIWEKTNQSPMNGEFMWLSGVECCVYGKKSGGTFNLRCKNSVLRYPCGEHDIHPTQKPVDMFRYLVQASSDEGQTVLDPFMGSGTTAVACIKEKRHFIGFELNEEYYRRSLQRVDAVQRQLTLF